MKRSVRDPPKAREKGGPLREQGALLTVEQVKAIRKLFPFFGGGRRVASRIGVHWSTLYRYLSREIRVGVGAKIALCLLFEEAGRRAPFSLGRTEQAIRSYYQHQ